MLILVYHLEGIIIIFFNLSYNDWNYSTVLLWPQANWWIYIEYGNINRQNLMGQRGQILGLSVTSYFRSILFFLSFEYMSIASDHATNLSCRLLQYHNSEKLWADRASLSPPLSISDLYQATVFTIFIWDFETVPMEWFILFSILLWHLSPL